MSGIDFPGCASRGRPGGGPVDKIPPQIVSTFPLPDSINVTDLDKIEIIFSERMKESSVENSIFISPPVDFEADWSGGTDLTMNLNQTLDTNRTYVITIGAGARDARDNRMEESFQLAFSTGQQLDMGQVSGSVYGLQKQDIFYIYAYRIVDPDSLDPTVNKADFLSQTSENGDFTVGYLPQGGFRVFVVEDQNRNLLLDANFERVGMPYKDVVLDSMNLVAKMINFKVSNIDTVPPSLTGAKAINNHKVLLRFSEPVMLPEQIDIIDTLALDTLAQKALIVSKESSSQVYVLTANQDSIKTYSVNITDLADSSGNRANELQAASFTGSALSDTTKFELLEVSPKDSSRNVKYPAVVKLKFSLPIDETSLNKSFICFNSVSDTVKGIWQSTELTEFYFRPESNFLPGREYNFILRTEGIRSVQGHVLTDTLITNRFFMISDDEFGSISGSTNLPDQFLEAARINIYSVKGKKMIAQTHVQADNTFYAEWLSAGEYQLGGYLDIDADGKFTPGSLFPFRFSEPYFISTDTIAVRKRWEVSDIKVLFPEVE